MPHLSKKYLTGNWARFLHGQEIVRESHVGRQDPLAVIVEAVLVGKGTRVMFFS